MNLTERLRILEAAEDDLAMLALATVDLAHGSLPERRARADQGRPVRRSGSALVRP